MEGIIAEAIKHKCNHKTVHETKYIDVGWTGIATSMKAGMAIIVHGICAGWPTYYKVYKGETLYRSHWNKSNTSKSKNKRSRPKNN